MQGDFVYQPFVLDKREQVPETEIGRELGLAVHVDTIGDTLQKCKRRLEIMSERIDHLEEQIDQLHYVEHPERTLTLVVKKK